MGYLLIQPIQSQQYANRLNAKPYNFAHVERLNKINLKSDFLDDFEAHLFVGGEQEEHEKEREGGSSEHQSSAQALKGYGYIHPNPVNLSPAISQIVGKGININAYRRIKVCQCYRQPLF